VLLWSHDAFLSPASGSCRVPEHHVASTDSLHGSGRRTDACPQVPVLRVQPRGHDEQDAVELDLLALRGVRRDLESGASQRRGDGPHPPMVASAPAIPELIDDLRDLVAALDRRVPRLERAGEAEITRDAAFLRAAALTRIAELQR
jgi:hypothetical protein